MERALPRRRTSVFFENAVQPDAGPRRHRRGQPARARRRRHGHDRQRVRHPVLSRRGSSAPTWSCTPRPSTSTARGGCSAARSWAPGSTSTARSKNPHPEHGPDAVVRSTRGCWLKGLGRLSAAGATTTASALRVAEWSSRSPGLLVPATLYLPLHPQHELARAADAGGGTVDDASNRSSPGGARRQEGHVRFAGRTRVIDISNNLGDAKSLITHPATRAPHDGPGRTRGRRHRRVDRAAVGGARGHRRPDRRPWRRRSSRLRPLPAASKARLTALANVPSTAGKTAACPPTPERIK